MGTAPRIVAARARLLAAADADRIALRRRLGGAVLVGGRACRVDAAEVAAAVPQLTLLAQLTAHVILISCMIVATFIDFDEQTIPDAVTLPGTLAGLTLMALWPAAAPPVLSAARMGAVQSGAPSG